MNKYKVTYKCRLCGAVFANGEGIFDRQKAFTHIFKFNELQTIHLCESYDKIGSFGIADFQGLEVVDNE